MTAPAEGTALVVQHLERTLGLSFTGPRRQRLLTAIDRTRAAAGMPQEAFLDAVARPGSAFDRLVAEVTVGETFFFRDREQCRLLREVVLPSLRERGPAQRVAFWSAGCASGEEAYTLAALADDAGLGDRCTVVGSDASARSVDRARVATYGRWSLRSTTAAEQAAHFVQQGERFQVAERHRRRTRFVQRNLLDGPPPPGRFDVVLCRNLLIYLTPEAVRRAAVVLTRSLADDGWLLTAAGDPPLAAEGLEAVRTGLGLAYRRVRVPLPGTGRAAVPTPSPRAAPRRPAAPPAAQPVSRAGPPEAAPAAELAATVRALGDAGRLEDACRLAADAVRAHPLDVELRYLSGVVLLEAGRIDQAAAAAASTVYLGPELPAAHLLLGQAEHARGETARARRSFRNAARLLAAAPADAPVALAGDVPPEHLAAIASRYLAAETHR